MKKKVKNYLEQDIYNLVKNTNDINDARNIIKSNLINIENNIDSIFKTNNYNLNYKVNYGENYFPEKAYNRSYIEQEKTFHLQQRYG